ncbi:hotdog domain-containing protein [Kiritimatiellaeota bacterium B1221]|nr:hotdog domain-containing protein [Kiritimatiellaeota bacterium B1221]
MSLFQYDRLPQFAESDAAGIIHFSDISRYVEEAEHAFLRSAGFPVTIHDPLSLKWPRVSFKANYTRPLLPFQQVQVNLVPIYVGRSSINWKWSISLPQSEEALCEGEMKVVCCVLKGEKLETCPLPSALKEMLISPV